MSGSDKPGIDYAALSKRLREIAPKVYRVNYQQDSAALYAAADAIDELLRQREAVLQLCDVTDKHMREFRMIATHKLREILESKP